MTAIDAPDQKLRVPIGLTAIVLLGAIVAALAGWLPWANLVLLVLLAGLLVALGDRRMGVDGIVFSMTAPYIVFTHYPNHKSHRALPVR